MGVIIFGAFMDGLTDNILKERLKKGEGTVHMDGWRRAPQAEERVNVKP